MKKIIDISVPLSPGLPVWPGDQSVTIIKQMDMEIGAEANLTNLKISSHTGTHIDAPLHFVKNGKTTADIPLEKLIGNCTVFDCQGKEKITADDLSGLNIREGIEKLLLKTDNSKIWEEPEHAFMKIIVR